MRGEERKNLSSRSWNEELPPHARRRVRRCASHDVLCGITSACAEKSNRRKRNRDNTRNYLRMRGEENRSRPSSDFWRELPPHARRRGCAKVEFACCAGITSACAEKSMHSGGFTPRGGNYLRMRGEEPIPGPSVTYVAELPPHARRRAPARIFAYSTRGITSACAEKRHPHT